MMSRRIELTAEPPRIHDPNHPYVRRLVGCGHGRLFTEPCVDCEVVGLMEKYRGAMRDIERVKARMQQLGRPMPDQQEKSHD